jgi:hypothetical protein
VMMTLTWKTANLMVGTVVWTIQYCMLVQFVYVKKPEYKLHKHQEVGIVRAGPLLTLMSNVYNSRCY